MATASLSKVNDFPSFVEYLSDELDWPVDLKSFEDRSELAEELTYDFLYNPEQLGIPKEMLAKVSQLRQMVPLVDNQPWAVFYVEFESKRLPVTVLRRILNLFVEKKRASSGDRVTWKMQDLLFVNGHGADEERAMTFAHFSPPETGYTAVMREFMWNRRETHLAHTQRYMESLRWPDEGVSQKEWRAQWRSAFVGSKRKAIKDSRDLAEEMAHFAHEVRQRVSEVLELTRKKTSDPLQQLYVSFKKLLIHDLGENDFADTYAQTMAYGLFAARVAKPEENFRLKNAPDKIPPTNPFLRSLFRQCLGLSSVGGGRIDIEELGVRRLVELFEALKPEDIIRILDEFGSQTGDPVIHFYEHFLYDYDKEKKVQRGVFYTPQPVVSYIVRSVHKLLQKEFGIEDGLASTITWSEMAARNSGIKIPDGVRPDQPFVLVLDPATGTTTFLVEVIEVIFKHLKAKWAETGKRDLPSISYNSVPIKSFAEYWNAYVPNALLPRLYGYELMMAPYTIAHIKLGLKLSEINARLDQPDYHFNFEGRAHIYLTNALDSSSDIGQQTLVGIFPALAEEAQAVNNIKRRRRFTVIIGNPPYSLHSANLEPHHRKMIEAYKFIGKERIQERGALQLEKNLNDDYVKFFRLAQVIVEHAGVGLLGLITNHSFLDNPTMRGLRWSLLQTASCIHIIDLHGNTTKQESPPGGSEDKNVFQIKQGVAITLLTRRLSKIETSKIFHYDLWGSQESKDTWLSTHKAFSHPMQPIEPSPDLDMFIPQDTSLKNEFEAGFSLPIAMPSHGAGYITARDNLVVDFDREVLIDCIQRFNTSSLDEQKLLETFRVSQKKGWNVTRARKQLKQVDITRQTIKTNYRPFDSRWIFFDSTLVWGRSWPTMKHLANRQDNISLLATRMTKDKWDVFVARTVSSHKAMSAYDTNSVFPLYLNEESELNQISLLKERRVNFDKDFLNALFARLQSGQPKSYDLSNDFTPEDIFYYIYAVLQSPYYRQRYVDFLKTDFPRIPLTGNLDLFRNLIRFGGKLVSLHLVESPKLNDFITTVIGSGDFYVEKVSYSNETVWIDRGLARGIQGVPEDVWNFYIGGYQVCHKWLKDRGPKKGNPGRILTDEDIAHYQKIVVALNETIRLMEEIDEVIEEHGGWPDAFSV